MQFKMTDAIQQRETFNETKKAAKRALFKADSHKQGVIQTKKFFKILEDHNIQLSEKNKSQSIHDFQDHNNGHINYLDALRYIQASEQIEERWEVTKAQPRLRAHGTDEKAQTMQGFTTLVFNSPAHRMLNTTTIASPNHALME